jgi:hypothetical protein
MPRFRRLSRAAPWLLLWALLSLPLQAGPARAACGTTWVVAVASYVPQTIWREYFSFQTMILIRIGYLNSDSVRDLMAYRKQLQAMLISDIQAKRLDFGAEIKIQSSFEEIIYSEEASCEFPPLARKSVLITEYIKELWKRKPLGSLQFSEDLEHFIVNLRVE